MKFKFIFIISFVSIMNPLSAGSPSDPDSANTDGSEISWGLETDLNNKYLWRGITYDDGFVIQPDVWISYRNFTLGAWSNVASHDKDHPSKLNEVDLTLSCTYALLNLEIENSFMYYHYPQQMDSPPTGEFNVTVGCPSGEFKWITNFTIDVLEYPGAFYFENGMEFDDLLTTELNLAFSLNLGWASKDFNEMYVGVSKTAMNMISATLSLDYYPTACLCLKPHLQVNKTLDKDLYEAMEKYSGVYGLLIGMEF